MDNTTQERPNVGPILNFNKRHYRRSLNKKFGTHVEKAMVFKTLKNKQCNIIRNKVINGNGKPSSGRGGG